jgi:prepilin-type N-terminal cleavage/methylation domain-containing protein
MTPAQVARRRHQAGYTLIELIIASALGLLVMGALTSVVLTTALAGNTATSRVEASSQVRNFQLSAFDDIALARPPAPSGCGTADSPCTTQDMVLQGSRMPNQQAGTAAPYIVTYTWNPDMHQVMRSAEGTSRVAADSVTDYSWYIDSSGAHPSVVVRMTVTVGFYNTSYSESQTFRFYPRVTAPS